MPIRGDLEGKPILLNGRTGMAVLFSSRFQIFLSMTVPGFPWRGGATAPWIGIYTEGRKNRSKSLPFHFFSCPGKNFPGILESRGDAIPDTFLLTLIVSITESLSSQGT